MNDIVTRTYDIMRKIERIALFELNDTVTRSQVESALNAEFGTIGTFVCDHVVNPIELIDLNGFHVVLKAVGFTQGFMLGVGDHFKNAEHHRFHNRALVYLVENQIDHTITWSLDFSTFPTRFSTVDLWVNRNQTSEKNELLFKLKLQMEQ